MNIQQICEEFLYGQDLRKEASYINRKSLTSKFERSHQTIAYIVNGGQPPNVSDWEANMIRTLVADHNRLLVEASKYSQARLAAKYNVSRERIGLQLQLMGWKQEEQASA